MTLVFSWIDKEDEKFVLKVRIGTDNKIYKMKFLTIEEAIAQQEEFLLHTRVRKFYNVSKE